MADLLESTCYEILCLLLESVEPALPDGDLYLRHELAVCGLTSFVDALRKRGSSVVLRPHHQLRHRLFDLAQLILLTDVGELANEVDDLVFDLLELCRALQPDPVRRNYFSASKRVRIAFDCGSSDTFVGAQRTNDAKHYCALGAQQTNDAKHYCALGVQQTNDAKHYCTSSEMDSNRGYLKIGYLLEAYVRCSNTKRKMDVWCHVESVVSEFVVRDKDRSCVALRRRLDEVVEMVGIMAVVEDGTPLRCFLQPQIEEIFAALKEDALEGHVSLGDRVRLAKRRFRRWLERFLIRVLHCLRCSLATAAC